MERDGFIFSADSVIAGITAFPIKFSEAIKLTLIPMMIKFFIIYFNIRAYALIIQNLIFVSTSKLYSKVHESLLFC